jgi:hypothetical protein
VLGAHQAGISDTFAGRPRAGAPFTFDPADWIPGLTGAPVLARAAASSYPSRS